MLVRQTGAVPVSMRMYGLSKCGHEWTKHTKLVVMPHLLCCCGFMLEQDMFSNMTDEPEALESVQMDGKGPLRYTHSCRDRLGKL